MLFRSRTLKLGARNRSMKSSTAPSFWQAYQSLPPEVRAQARKTYRLWQLLELLSRARLGRALAPEHHWANSSSCRRRREESHYSATNTRSETPHVVSYNTWSHELALRAPGHPVLVLDRPARSIRAAVQVISGEINAEAQRSRGASKIGTAPFTGAYSSVWRTENTVVPGEEFLGGVAVASLEDFWVLAINNG